MTTNQNESATFRARPCEGGAEILKIDGEISNDTLVVPGTIAFTNISGEKIRARVVRIGDRAFAGRNSIKSITLPEGVTDVGEGAFCACDALENVVLPNGLRHIEIRAFAKCKSLKTVDIPESVTTIGRHAFKKCETLASVVFHKGAALAIGDRAFCGCDSLRAIELPTSVAKVGEEAFPQNCNVLRVKE